MGPALPRRGARRHRRGLAVATGLVAVGAVAGAEGLAAGTIDFGATITSRLPFGSPVFAAVALLVVVGAPMAVAAVQCWRGGRRADQAAMVAGVLLMGWIVVETAVIRSFSWLQPVFLLTGAAVAFAGYRGWHLRWGVSDDELTSPMPGDEIDVPDTFSATRGITIAAPPMAVWPWLTQVGVGRAGFYSYDRLDNGGRPSAREILPEFEVVSPGDLAAPMAGDPTPLTSFVVASVDVGRSLVWAKSDAVWAWQLVPTEGGTRLLVRLRTGPEWRRPLQALVGAVLLEIGDFPMMHKMLDGIRERAEALTAAAPVRSEAPA